MKRLLRIVAAICLSLLVMCSCKSKESSKETSAVNSDNKSNISASKQTEKEKKSIKEGKLSKDSTYYGEVVIADPECKDYISEVSMYDEQINDTFIMHISLPPDYDKNKKYPMIVMTDGVWRLSDHPEVRKMMKDNEIKPVILVDIGYPPSYDYQNIRERDLVNSPDKFLHFISDDLVPYLEGKYSVDKDNLSLVGHSCGGYFGLYAIFNSDTITHNMFKNYYIGSPALAAKTDGNDIYYYEKQFYDRNKTLDINVYMSVSNGEWPVFVKYVDDFDKLFASRQYKDLNYKYDKIDGYDHNHSYKPTFKSFIELYYKNK